MLIVDKIPVRGQIVSQRHAEGQKGTFKMGSRPDEGAIDRDRECLKLSAQISLVSQKGTQTTFK
jgi:hypothetical protein